MKKISGLILAAGQSKRFGKNKLLLPIGGKSVIGKVVESFLASELFEVILVVGYQSSLVRAEIPCHFRLRIVENPDYKKGMATSIKAALPYLNPSSEAIMVALGDQPLISKNLIDDLLVAYDTSGKKSLIPYHEGRRGHPVIVDLTFRHEIEEIKGDEGLRGILCRHHDDVLAYQTGDSAVILDLDTPDDYQRLLI